ncbi:MAG: hypothetical protein CL994_02210 [Euryarchaeota archaeon]|nr:hypothetical protein [Euryarchaeota archaeon]
MCSPMMLILAGTLAVLLILFHHGMWPCFRVRSEADLVFMTAFWVCADDLVSLSLWPGNLHPASTHRAMVGDGLWLLLGYFLDVLQIA